MPHLDYQAQARERRTPCSFSRFCVRTGEASALALLASLILLLAGPGMAKRPTWYTARPAIRNVERTWLGPELWANRLQDWQLRDGRIVCLNDQLPMRTVHLLTCRPAPEAGEVMMKVRFGLVSDEEPIGDSPVRGAAGFLFAVAPDVDHRAAALVHQSPGPGGGIFAGVDASGQLVVRDNREPRLPGGPYKARGVYRKNWKVLAVDSFEPDFGEGANAFDGNPETVWHTKWREARTEYPHHLSIDFGKPLEVAALRYLPRQNNNTGRIRDYAVYLSNDAIAWGDSVAEGQFADQGEAVIVKLDKPRQAARYLRLEAKSEHNDRPAAAVAEIEVLDPDDLARLEEEEANKPAPRPLRDVKLRMNATIENGSCTVRLALLDGETEVILDEMERFPSIPLESFAGNLCIVSDPYGGTTRFWFSEWEVRGDFLERHPERSLGPILSTQYTLSKGILKMTAQMMPIGPCEPHQAELQVADGGSWKTVDRAPITTDSLTATFRVENWDDSKDTPCRVVYDDGAEEYTREATVRRDPVDKPDIVVAGFTGNHNTLRGVGGQTFPWTRDGLWFPHEDITRHVAMHDPDVLFFSGDQVYEGASPTPADRAHIRLDYLYKWYLWCWAYRDLTRDRPSIAIPDDHDVYQGNLWGQGGRKAPTQNSGGYVHPAWFVRMVERTQSSNLPDPWDPTPIEQNIGVYYTEMTYGRVGFAILEDRKFKTGPEGVVPDSGGRSDHVPYPAPDYDPKTADVPGAKLLGDRQLEFLEAWTRDWAGQDMKMALSQTVFANVATLHGGNLMRLIADYDSNGWPQSGRNRALAKLRKGFAPMLCGDQHLATLVHHGIDDWNDAGWSLCVPSVANFYPRAWVPLEPGRNRKPGMPEYTGEFLDGLGNHVTVMAATNPGKDGGREPAALHNRMPGYGIVRCHKGSGTYTMECWPRYAVPGQDAQYEGWPLTVSMLDNYAEFRFWLPTVQTRGLENPVVQVVREKDGEVVYTLRARGDAFQPGAFEEGTYTVGVGEPSVGKWRYFEGLDATESQEAETLAAEF